MVNWLLMLLILVIVFFILKYFIHHKIRLWMWRAMIIFAIFLLISGFYFSKTKNMDVSDLKGKVSFVKSYTGWLISGFKNIASTTGNVVKEVKSEFSNSSK